MRINICRAFAFIFKILDKLTRIIQSFCLSLPVALSLYNLTHASYIIHINTYFYSDIKYKISFKVTYQKFFICNKDLSQAEAK